MTRKITWVFVAVASCLSLLNAQAPRAGLSPSEAADGWLMLWDGETTFGWEPALRTDWTIAEGALKQAPGAFIWLRHKAPFADFVLELDFKMLNDDADSGVFIRAAAEGDPSRTGYQININNRNEEFGTGSLVYRVKYNGSKVSANEWHHYRITAEGDRITAVLDGKQTLDVRDPTSAAGHIGFQFVKPDEVQFRNVRLKPLGRRPLFNGSDLAGWERVDRQGTKEPPEWTVRGSAIHVEKGPGQLETSEFFGDFLLQLEIRANAGDASHHPNSGVFFRGAKGGYWTGYESQIRNEYKGGDRAQAVDFGTGGLYGYQAARRVVSSDNEFFTKTIVAVGRQISIWVNGIQTADFTDTREAGTESKRQARLQPGPISLQAHDPTTNLDFRNIRILALPPKP